MDHSTCFACGLTQNTPSVTITHYPAKDSIIVSYSGDDPETRALVDRVLRLWEADKAAKES